LKSKQHSQSSATLPALKKSSSIAKSDKRKHTVQVSNLNPQQTAMSSVEWQKLTEEYKEAL